MSIETYYRERAREYDNFYRVPRRQDELAQLRAWLLEHCRGATILEVAAGTGYWTEVVAGVAQSITATDCNKEVLAILAQRPLGSRAKALVADAYALPRYDEAFDVGMAHLWWSHVAKERQADFLKQFTARLQPGATVLMLDQTYEEGISIPTSRTDAWGNNHTLRTLENGAVYEIIKNYPSDEELRECFATVCDDIRIAWTQQFWALTARVRG
jgi:ubiquinone/menaquinone biosynthesis C-methylase UbiE